MRSLYKHQKDALAYLRSSDHSALFVEMRLGKTLVTVRWLDAEERKEGRPLDVLVVAPNSALPAWEKELRLEGNHNIVDLGGTRENRIGALTDGQPGWYLINKEGFLALPEVAYMEWDAVIIDESTTIKNPKAKISKFYTKFFRDVPRRLILSGMPSPETPLELFQQFKFLYGSMMGHRNYWSFRQRFFRPDWFGYKWLPQQGTMPLIEKWVGQNSFIMSREDAGYFIEKVPMQRVVYLPDRLRESYERAEKEFVLSLDDQVLKETQWLLERHTWFRRMAGGWVGGKQVWKGKEQEIVDLLSTELHGQQVVVWYSFNKEARSTFGYLNKAGIRCLTLTGEHTTDSRKRRIAKFQDGKTQVLLVQTKCASLGLDLSAANTAIYFSSPPSREIRSQSEDRILALKKNEPLLIIDIVSADTVDEDIQWLLERKLDQATSLLELAKRMEIRVLGR